MAVLGGTVFLAPVLALEASEGAFVTGRKVEAAGSSHGDCGVRPVIAESGEKQREERAGAAVVSRRSLFASAAALAALALSVENNSASAAQANQVTGRIPGLSEPDANGLRTYRRPDGKSGGHGVGWSPMTPYSFKVPQDWEEVPVSIAALGGTEIDFRFQNSQKGNSSVVVAPVEECAVEEASTSGLATHMISPVVLYSAKVIPYKMQGVGVTTSKGVACLGHLSSYRSKRRSSLASERLKTCGLWTTNFSRRQIAASHKFAPLRNLGSITVRAFSNDKDDWSSSDDDNQWDPSYEIEVPSDQRPVNELAALKEAALYSWAQLTVVEFGVRLAGLWVFFFVLLGGPIAAASFEPTREPLKFFLAGGAGSLFAVSVLVLRMYLGWSYVGDRLLSAIVPYEETGWYDGQLYVKPPEILARDRLLGSYQVKPVMNRLKQTLIGAGTLLVTATAALLVLLPSQQDMDIVTYPPPRNRSDAIAAGNKPPSRKVDILNVPAEVMNDDDMAAAAAAAANGRPAYCTDRYYRALAGGQYCKWEDLRK